MMNFQTVVLVLGFALANAQLCPDGSDSIAPCFDGTCQPGTNSACDPTGQLCCVNAVATTAAASIVDSTTVFDATATAATVTISRSSTNSPISTNCVDKVNPSTGVSDCPARASLCNDSTYFAVMTDQCPKTCGRCSNSNSGTSGSCVDLVNPSTGVSDCQKNANLCNDSNYITLMRTQCPKTCGFCSSSSSSTASSITGSSTVSSGTCADLVNPNTGVSDCPSNVRLCNDSNYQTLMRTQCPRTCGFC